MSVKKKTPQRQCVGCGEMKNKRDMIRILKTAEGEIVLDATGKKNGRGAYICHSKECFQKAVKKYNQLSAENDILLKSLLNIATVVDKLN